MSDLPDLNMAPTLTLSLDPDNDAKFRLSGGTYLHKDRIATIPGSRFVGGGADYWHIPRSWAALKVVVRLFPGQLDWEPEAVEWANQIWSGWVEPSLTLRNEGAKDEWVEAVSRTLPQGIVPKS